MTASWLMGWSKAVRERDGKCCECGSIKALNAHHIKRKSTHPELALNLDNGITLCSNCHNEHHKGEKHQRTIISLQASGVYRAKKAILKAENAILKAENAILKAENTALKQEIKNFEDLQEQIKGLEGQISEYEKAYNTLIAWDA